ncbi:MAG: hypothetical protein JW829_13760 [Pirellulales bacterium]|nr:hypothetical protein [Pirellulales bacterium]
MKPVLKTVSWLGLALTAIPSLFVLNHVITKQSHFALMTIGLVLWFATAPFWMKSASLADDANSCVD